MGAQNSTQRPTLLPDMSHFSVGVVTMAPAKQEAYKKL